MTSGMWTSFGYVLSIASVALLAVVAWPGVRDDVGMQAALAFGVLLSIAGMIARWIAHQRDGKRISRLED
jgi:heme O synthase-like polyprenyltransferase